MYLQTTIYSAPSEEDAEEFFRHYATSYDFVILGQVSIEWQWNLFSIFPDAFVSARVRRKHASKK
jgi:hypothetical protein